MRRIVAPFGRGVAAGIGVSALLAVAVLSAAVSFGAHLTRPDLPYPNADRLVAFEHIGAGVLEPSHPDRIPTGVVAALELEGGPWTSLVRVKDNQGMNVRGIGPITGIVASHDFLSMLGITPALGRAFVEGEDDPGAGYSIIVSYDFWRGSLAADPDVIGRVLDVEYSGDYTIVGVMPEDVRFPVLENPSFYLPLGSGPGGSFLDQEWTTVLATVSPGVTTQELDPIVTRAVARWQASDASPDLGPIQIRAVRFTGGYRNSEVARLLGALLGVAGLLLAIAAANIGTLAVLGTENRGRTFAIRRVLGAGTARLFVTLAVGSALPVLVGGFGGLALAHLWLGRVARSATPEVRFLIPGVDAESALVAVALLLLVSVGVTLLVAQAVHAAPLHSVLGRSGAGWRGRGSRTLRWAVGGQVAVGGGLLFVGLLFGEAIERHVQLDRGYNAAERYVLSLPPGTPLAPGSWEQLRLDPGLSRGALAVGPAPTTPVIENSTGALRAAGGESLRGRHWLLGVSAEYAELLELRLSAGRFIDEAEVTTAARVAVIDEGLAQRHWPDRSAVGGTLELIQEDGSWIGYRVVGVVGGFALKDARTGLDLGQVMVPFTVAERRAPQLLVRVAGGVPPATVADRVDALLATTGETSVVALETLLSRTAASQLLFSRVLRLAAAVGLATALVGLFGVVGQATQRRRSEFGVRRALGSNKPALAGLAVADAMGLTSASVVVGVGAALACSFWFRPMLLGASPWDVGAMLLVAVVVSGTTIVASLGPALWAASVSPVEAMRADD